ncbi:hypothetical protein AA0113_g12495 [Alternaria arborescens]|uniref:Ubiquitin 3 binding protein But2 C-terminal domain-containing protein n=3 Tax=Alternaria sect. Alternaria TaxID=2499237 RepID=A0A4Q4MIM1_ALTAL|nr:hypothetical protein AA0115_g13088 [Alternaria tenuissima]RYN15533.1 hypothetical protein AA0112_g12743 [Alternaria arborescens]RYN52412.1 hypothetical protein AA0117_g13370 [Alternaria alternata]RYN35554.1 hypothetical protein AA0114_g11762 [Alternaria tenuissima]RYN80006.1 hypothetical protein AA0119_g13515 [Alternaria tenuissima]
MRFSTSAVALAAVSFASALPTNTYPSTPTSCTTSVSSSTSCSSATPTPQPCKLSCPPPPSCNTSYPPPPDCHNSCPTPPVNTPCGNPTGSNIIKPRVNSLYEVWTGAVRHNTTNGKIFKDGKTTDITTLLTFDFPPESEGKTCSFHFNLASDASVKVSGTGQLDVFTSLTPATGSTSSWPSGNLRDQHLGRMTAQRGGAATWVSGFPTLGQGFPCPAGKTYGGELVGVGDADFIEWLAGTSGASIQWC